MKRPTIADIARTAGVSKGAVSYALNGRPGVSEPTRRRIMAIAEELGWAPSSAARALSDGRAGAIGLVVDRPARVLGVEPFFMQLISGIQAALAGSPTALLLQVSDHQEAELATYRRWWAERRVDGTLLVDLQERDRRVDLVQELGLPAVVLGGPAGVAGLPCVWTDDGVAVAEVLEYLSTLGHRRIVRVAGPEEFLHTQARSAAFTECAARLGLDQTRIVHTDYSGEAGARVARRLLASAEAPTALLFDNDLMAVAAVAVAQELGIAVPGQLSVVAWDDSVLCRLVHPALTAVRRPIAEYGVAAVTLLQQVLAGQRPDSVRTADPILVPRASTGPAPR
ncbi:LacI family DNA-binding transcriptional regulator [Goodfellowiella coeruleoviolacea]|uniref:Transcriptional regulator, LacI family n=1 Tax=Goodfellowiella coeruleoviolacea TaxID=334858 RepID=A0AAE3GB48_9PSEU|nr:LacI family DNA-binding transcriptional regulator [Goodfellowiella coeruleoviolacea]MCP2164154.1 transcriptional regulator, LacI family [Goodfellowiella coeruleoviolacea]